MKRNLVPLIAVALAVAIVSTGIFYGLFVGKLKGAPTQTVVTAARELPAGTTVTDADLNKMDWAGSAVPQGMYVNAAEVTGKTLLQPVDAGEPILSSRLVSKSGSGGGVPQGMRAVSVHISDSSGVIALLKPGHKVDLQVFGMRVTSQGQEGMARTAFQNITVLSVNPQAEASSQGNFNAPVVTVLVTPADADGLGVADSFGRIRLALRNPTDGGTAAKGTLPLTALYKGSGMAFAEPVAQVTAPPVGKPVTSQAPAKTQVGLNVELVSASAEAIATLKRYGVNGVPDVLGTSTIVQPADLDRVLAQLRDEKSIDVLSLSKVTAAMSRTAAVELQGREAGALRVQFSPFMANGQLKLRVQPELTVRGGASPGTRSLETEVDITSGRGFVISGLRDTTAQAVAGGRQLLVLVRPNL